MWQAVQWPPEMSRSYLLEPVNVTLYSKEPADMIKNFEAGRLYEKALKAITSEPIKKRQRKI